MTLLDSLRAARVASTTTSFRLLYDYVPKGKTVHAFFEGRDDESFYVNFLHAHCPDGWRLILYRCGSKSKVFEVWRRAAGYDQLRLLFFVDKDHDDLVGVRDAAESATNVFVTEWYSIENYLVVDDILRRILRDILHLDISVAEEDAVVAMFLDQRDEFYRHLIVISAWIVLVRRSGIPLHVANIDMSDLFEVNPDATLRRRRVGQVAYLCARCSVPMVTCAWKNLLVVARELKTLKPKEYVRGKFDLWFLVAFTHRLPSLLATLYGKGVERIRTPITNANGVEVLGPRLRIPRTLEKFLAERMKGLAS